MVRGETDKLAAGLSEVVTITSQPITEIVEKTREQSPNDVNSKLVRSDTTVPEMGTAKEENSGKKLFDAAVKAEQKVIYCILLVLKKMLPHAKTSSIKKRWVGSLPGSAIMDWWH